jgi:Tol biopolymer transport system component
MRRVMARVLMATLLPLAACSPGDSHELPPCPKPITSDVVAPGLGGRLAFETTGLAYPGYYHCSSIFMMNADGSGLRRVTTEREMHPTGVKRSPTGGLYVYWGDCTDAQSLELCLVDEDGSGRRPLHAGPVGPVNDADPAWSPDGSRIVFTRRPAGGPLGTSSGPGDLYIVGADGTGERRLTTDPGDESQPAWSPDGQTIAYVATDGTRQLRLIKSSGGPPTVLAPGGTANDSPAFSSVGRRLAFSSDRSNKPESAHVRDARTHPGSENLPVLPAQDIYVVGVDGKGLTRLTGDASSNFSPVWSPDDHHIAFLSDRDDKHSPFVMAADGTNVVRFVPMEVSSLNWFT